MLKTELNAPLLWLTHWKEVLMLRDRRGRQRNLRTVSVSFAAQWTWRHCGNSELGTSQCALLHKCKWRATELPKFMVMLGCKIISNNFQSHNIFHSPALSEFLLASQPNLKTIAEQNLGRLRQLRNRNEERSNIHRRPNSLFH